MSKRTRNLCPELVVGELQLLDCAGVDRLLPLQCGHLPADDADLRLFKIDQVAKE